jgi:hypothetical protein
MQIIRKAKSFFIRHPTKVNPRIETLELSFCTAHPTGVKEVRAIRHELATFVPRRAGVGRIHFAACGLAHWQARRNGLSPKRPNGEQHLRSAVSIFLNLGKNEERSMLQKLGRLLQIVGLFVILPLAMAGQIMERLTLGEMFLWVAIGAIVFYIGRNMQPRQ